jgi:hypothetical protein
MFAVTRCGLRSKFKGRVVHQNRYAFPHPLTVASLPLRVWGNRCATFEQDTFVFGVLLTLWMRREAWEIQILTSCSIELMRNYFENPRNGCHLELVFVALLDDSRKIGYQTSDPNANQNGDLGRLCWRLRWHSPWAIFLCLRRTGSQNNARNASGLFDTPQTDGLRLSNLVWDMGARRFSGRSGGQTGEGHRTGPRRA